MNECSEYVCSQNCMIKLFAMVSLKGYHSIVSEASSLWHMKITDFEKHRNFLKKFDL